MDGMDGVVVEIRAFEPLLNTAEVAVLLAAITLYGVLSMANFAVLGFTVARRSRDAFRACGLLAAVNYISGLAAIPILGGYVGLPMVGEVAALMYLELAVLALIVSQRAPAAVDAPGLVVPTARVM